MMTLSTSNLSAACVAVLYFFTCFQIIHCATHNIYWTKLKTSDLKWSSIGWEEVSGFDRKEGTVRTYQVCQSHKPNQDNWVRSTYIDAKGAKRLHIEIEFSITKCDSPMLKNAKYCRETFNLFYYQSDGDVASSTFPPWRENSYEKVDTVAANADGKINKKTFTIANLKRKGLYVAAQDQGACMSINSLRVYFYECPQITEKLATFPLTKAGGEPTSLVPLAGQCVAHAQRVNGEAPTYHCNSDGNWTIFTGGCQCDPGYRRNFAGTACHACRPGTFKVEAGNEGCITCPENSGPGVSNNATNIKSIGLNFCACLPGFFRADHEQKTAGCTKPPSKPTALAFKANSTAAILKWNLPENLGGRSDTTYGVKCLQCHSKTYSNCLPCISSVRVGKPRSSLTGGDLTVSGLRPFTPYVMRIFARNGVSAKSEKDPEYEEARIFTSEAAPSMITNIYVANRHLRALEIKWRPPQRPNGIIRSYEIETRLSEDSKAEAKANSADDTPQAPILKESEATTATIEDLEPGTSYFVRIRAKNSVGFGVYSETVQFQTLPSNEPEVAAPPEGGNTIAIIIVAVVIFVAVAFLVVFLIFRSRGQLTHLSTDKQKSASQKSPSGHERESLTGHRIYVEYPDPTQAVKTLNKELDPKDLTVLDKLIGEGEFAQVLHGKLVVDGVCQRVAVKQLKHGASVKDQSNFLREACSMAQFDHPNILQLKGVVTKSRPVMIVSEYMENGSLDEFLRNHRGEYSLNQLVSMLNGIAGGMRYLSEMKYVHRDLAARNILINSELVCKVSDFGLSRTLENDPRATYTTQGGKIAIRWAAPECIRYRQFTSSSDVWSYGIVMWEVMSYGVKPYWDMTNQQVVQDIESGMRLPAPTGCPKVLHNKMLECWSLDPNNRPKFSELVNELENLKNIQRTNSSIQANNSSASLANSCATPNLQHALNHGEISTVEEWLKCQKLDKYKDRFLARGLDTLDKVSNLTIKDLRSLGIDVTLHVHKLENGIRSLRRHLSTSSSRPTSSYSMEEDLDQGDDDVMLPTVDRNEGIPKPMRNGSLRLPATQEETSVLIPEGSVEV